MDNDKDGIIGKSDLRATFDAVGKLSNEKELDEMLNEASGPINFTQLLGLFGTRMQDSGGTDDDEVVIAAFKSFDEEGTIDGDKFRWEIVLYMDTTHRLPPIHLYINGDSYPYAFLSIMSEHFVVITYLHRL